VASITRIDPTNCGPDYQKQTNHPVSRGRRNIQQAKDQPYKWCKYIPFLSTFVAVYALYKIAKATHGLNKKNINKFDSKQSKQILAAKIRAVSTWVFAFLVPIIGNLAAFIWDKNAQQKKNPS